MNYSDKQQLFEDFNRKWEMKFHLAKQIVLNLSGVLSEKLGNVPLLSVEELEGAQLEWIALVRQLDHPVDACFFKDLWLPISKGEYEHFIDLSQIGFPLFRIHYGGNKPYRWTSEILIQTTSLLLLSDDPGSEIDAELNRDKNPVIDPEEVRRKKHKRKGLLGQIEPSKAEFERICFGNPNDCTCTLNLEENRLKLEHVNALAIGLLPADLKITLYEFEGDFEEDVEDGMLVRTIKGLNFLFEFTGAERVHFFLMYFKDSPQSGISYRDGNFWLRHDDHALLESVYERFRGICEQ